MEWMSTHTIADLALILKNREFVMLRRDKKIFFRCPCDQVQKIKTYIELHD